MISDSYGSDEVFNSEPIDDQNDVVEDYDVAKSGYQSPNQHQDSSEKVYVPVFVPEKTKKKSKFCLFTFFDNFQANLFMSFNLLYPSSKILIIFGDATKKYVN